MPVMDEFREQREALKKGPLKQKLIYFWYYYKWHTVAVLIGIFFLYSLLHSFLSQKQTAFYAAFLNATENGDNPRNYASEFGEAAGIDMEQYEVVFDASLFIDYNNMNQTTIASSQKMMVYIASGDMDMIVTDTDSIEHYAYLDTLIDMRELLTPQQQEKYEPYYYYIDRTIVKEQQEANDNMDTDYVAVHPANPFDPETMDDPVPVGICMDSCKVLRRNYVFKNGSLVFGAFRNSKHLDIALKYLEYTFP